MKKFLFGFTQYGCNSMCYVAVREDGSIYQNESSVIFREVTGISYLDKDDMQLCSYKGQGPDVEVYKVKGYDKCFIKNYSPEYMAYLESDYVPGQLSSISGIDRLTGITFVEDSDLEYYKYEEDPEEKYWRDVTTYMERDRDGDEGYSYPEY